MKGNTPTATRISNQTLPISTRIKEIYKFTCINRSEKIYKQQNLYTSPNLIQERETGSQSPDINSKDKINWHAPSLSVDRTVKKRPPPAESIAVFRTPNRLYIPISNKKKIRGFVIRNSYSGKTSHSGEKVSPRKCDKNISRLLFPVALNLVSGRHQEMTQHPHFLLETGGPGLGCKASVTSSFPASSLDNCCLLR